MRAPKCKLCGAEHWGLCYVQPRAIRGAVATIEAKPKAKAKAAKAKAGKGKK